MVDHYGIAYGDGGQLIMNQFLGFLFGVLMAPFIVNLLGRKMTIMVALFLFMFSQFMLVVLPNWSILLYSVLFGGAVIGILVMIIAALIIGYLKDKKTCILMLTEVFLGVGALLIHVFTIYAWSFTKLDYFVIFRTIWWCRDRYSRNDYRCINYWSFKGKKGFHFSVN